MEVNEWPVALAPFQLGDLAEREMTLHRPNPAALRQDDGDRLLLDHCRPVDLARGRHFLDSSTTVIAEFVLDPGKVLLEPGALPLRTLDQLDEFVALLGEGLALAADFHLL